MLKPSQQYNLAKVCKIDILDRERLILRIFELRSMRNQEFRLNLRSYDMTWLGFEKKLDSHEQENSQDFLVWENMMLMSTIFRYQETIRYLEEKIRREETRRELFRIQQ